MCLLVFAWNSHPRYRFVFAGNRDEFHTRPTAAADWWDDPPGMLAGKDLEAGGTWLGINREGRFAVVTNFRDPDVKKPNAPSRGKLILNWIKDSGTREYIDWLADNGGKYSGFSLIVADHEALHYLTNKGKSILALTPGVHGLSNHVLNTPWPKVTRTVNGLREILTEDVVEPDALMSLLGDRTQAPDESLPKTGISLDQERVLSAPFIVGNNYGTRSSTVVLMDRAGNVSFLERRYDSQGQTADTRQFQFNSG